MKKYPFTSKKEKTQRNNNFQNNNIFNTGGGRIIDKDFDLRYYLEKAQGKMKSERKNKKTNSTRFPSFSYYSYLKNRNKELSPILSNFGNFSITSSFNKNTTDKNNYPPYLNTNYNTNNISTKYSNNAFITNKYSINNNSLDTFFKTNKNTNRSKPNKKLKSLYLTENNNGSKSNEFFNIYKAVKEIKSSLREKNKTINNDISVNQAYTQRLKPILAFDNNYLDVVFESNNLINKYNNRKDVELEKPQSLNNFLNSNQEIAVKNVMFNLIHNESEKLYNLTNKTNNKIQENKSILENNEKDFEDYTILQKVSCRNIEYNLIKLQDQNNKLLNKQRMTRGNYKLYLDEIIKLLFQIDDLRTYAIFVTEVFGKDSSKFEQEILPEYNSKNRKYEQIAEEVIENYSFYLINVNNKEEEFLNDADHLYNKYNEIELGIIRLLEEKEDNTKSLINYKKENKKALEELNKKYNNLLREYEIRKNNLEKELEKINYINNREKMANEGKEYENLIEEMYLCIEKTFSKNFSNKTKKNEKNEKKEKKEKKEKYDINYLLQESHKTLSEKEDLINNLLAQIDNYSKNDTKFYDQVIDKIKLEDKETKFLEFKKKHSEGMRPLKLEKNKRMEKIMFITGKYDPPFHKNTKKVKTTIDDKLIKRLENEELLSYE